MSLHKEYTCDVCGRKLRGCSAKAISSESAQLKLWVPDEPRSYGGQRIDLCVPCYELFVNFLESGGRRSEDDG